MPVEAPISKIEGCRALGAVVHIGGGSVDECVALARARAEEAGMAFVHPFDDPDVIAGQGTLGLELLDDIPDLAKIVVPVGGGGLSSGVAIAVKTQRPDVEVVGVQVDSVAAFPDSLRRGEPVGVDSALTIADGIAVKRPGDLTLPARPPVARRRRGRARGRRRRGDRALHGAGEARRRGRRRGRRRRAARRPDGPGAQRHDRASCSAAATSTPACSPTVARRHETDGRPPPRRLHPRPRPPRLARPPARPRRRHRREPHPRRAPARGHRPPRARDGGAADARDARLATTPTTSSRACASAATSST